MEHAEPEESESELEHRSCRLRSSMVDNQEEVVCVSPVEAFMPIMELVPLASHTLHRERKSLVTLQLLSCCRGTQLLTIAVR